MKLDYLEMLHAEFEVSSLNSMAVREIIRWAKKICDNNNNRQQQTDATGKLNSSLSRERELITLIMVIMVWFHTTELLLTRKFN